MNPKLQNILAIIAGWLVMVAVGAALFPLIKILYQGNYSYSFKNGMQINHFKITLYDFLWTGINAFTGGFVTCWIATERKILYSLLSGLIIFVLLIITAIVMGEFGLWGFLSALVFMPFTLMGGIVRKIVENKRTV